MKYKINIGILFEFSFNFGFEHNKNGCIPQLRKHEIVTYIVTSTHQNAQMLT